MLFITPHTQTDTTIEWGMRSQQSGASTTHTHAHLPTFTEGCSEMNVLSTAMTSSCSWIFLKSVKALPAVVCQERTKESRGVMPYPTTHCTLHTQATTHSAGSRHSTTPSITACFNYHMKPHDQQVMNEWWDTSCRANKVANKGVVLGHKDTCL